MSKLRTYSILFLFLSVITATSAQNSDNPFEIVARSQPTTTSEDVSVIEEIDTTQNVVISEPVDISLQIDTTNPFEVLSSNSIESSKALTSTVRSSEKLVSPQTSSKNGLATANRGALFGAIIVLSLLLAFLFAGFRSSFRKAYQNVINANILKQSYREMTTIGQAPLNLWYIFSWLSLGFFVFLLIRHYGTSPSTGFFTTLFYCIGSVSVLILLKHFVLFFIGSVFPVRKEVQLYNFLIVIFGIALGVLLVPFNILIAYLPEEFTQSAVYGALGLLLILYVLRTFRGLLISNRFLTFHRFHFLLYLCAIEIAPVIILLKLGLIYAGK